MENQIEKEELIKKVFELQIENQQLKKRLRNKRKRDNIKTAKKEIIDYWVCMQDECGLSVDWAEAEERCWRCGYKVPLQRCHIIPYSLGGKDVPENLVLLCKRCHAEAPNVESKTFMWDWIRSYGTPLYDTFWYIRAMKEYEFIYKKTYTQELEDRNIKSNRGMEKMMRTEVGRASRHFGQSWDNTATDVGILRIRLENYDKKYKDKKINTKLTQEKERKFEKLVDSICFFVREYNWSVWESGTKNKYAIVIYNNYDRRQKINISIKLCRDNNYRSCITQEYNPSNMKAEEYVNMIGKDDDQALDYIKKVVTDFNNKYGKAEGKSVFLTHNPMWKLEELEA